MLGKKCIIIHGCPSNAEDFSLDKFWILWAKKQLLAKNITIEVPLMPEPWKPDYKKFKTEFEKYSVNENTILIGHSCGCAFLVRWLGETKQKIAKLILVAPWKIPQTKKNGADVDFYTYAVDSTIKDRVREIIIFTADDEKEDGKQSVKIFQTALSGEIIELAGRGHYCFEEFPELLKQILK